MINNDIIKSDRTEHLEHRLSCSENMLHSMIYRSLGEMNFGGPHVVSNNNNDMYKKEINDLNFRSKNFSGKDELLFLGCSNTFGFELDLEHTWPDIISKKIKKSYANIASSGDSVFGQVLKAFQYFKEFGHPETIFASFPIFRLEVPMIKSKWQKDVKGYDQFSRIWIEKYDFKKIVKSPYNPVDVIPLEFCLYLSHSSISMLNQYCKSNNINFIWNVWDSLYYNESILYQINRHFDNYCISYSPEDLIEECTAHDDMKNYDTFNLARDNSHWGIHKNLHLAEDMLDKYALVAQRQRHAT